MPSRRMAANIEAVPVTTKFLGILVDPGDSAAHLIRHHAEIPSGFLDGDKVESDVVSAGIYEHLGREGIILGFSAKPSPAMNEDKDRCVRALRAIYVEFLDFRRAIRFAHGIPDATSHRLARGDHPL